AGRPGSGRLVEGPSPYDRGGTLSKVAARPSGPVTALTSAALASMAADEDAPEVPYADALYRPRGRHRSGSRADLCGPRHRRRARGSGRAPAAGPDALGASLGCGQPAVLQLVRSAGPEGSQRLPALRQANGSPGVLSTWIWL